MRRVSLGDLPSIGGRVSESLRLPAIETDATSSLRASMEPDETRRTKNPTSLSLHALSRCAAAARAGRLLRSVGERGGRRDGGRVDHGVVGKSAAGAVEAAQSRRAPVVLRWSTASWPAATSSRSTLVVRVRFPSPAPLNVLLRAHVRDERRGSRRLTCTDPGACPSAYGRRRACDHGRDQPARGRGW